jgi:hypothetical protein
MNFFKPGEEVFYIEGRNGKIFAIIPCVIETVHIGRDSITYEVKNPMSEYIDDVVLVFKSLGSTIRYIRENDLEFCNHGET